MEAAEALIACHTCGLVQRLPRLEPGTSAACARCEEPIRERKHGTLQVTAALSLAALVMYVPANVFPILRMNLYGAYSESTVWDGVLSLMRHDQWMVAAIVFMASIVVPLLKLAGLLFLVVAAKTQRARRVHEQTRIYKFIDAIGPWAMLDVFLLAILVSLVKLGDLATVLPGPGLAAFAAVVVLTLLASASFDPKVLWEKEERDDE
jgi:paraquat-inducible protein A